MDAELETGRKPRQTSAIKKTLIVAGILAALVILALAAGLVWMVRTREAVEAGSNRWSRRTPTFHLHRRLTAGWARSGFSRGCAWPGSSKTSGGPTGAFMSGLNAVPNAIEDIDSALRGSDMSLDEFGWILHELQAALRHEAARTRPAIAGIVHSIDARPSVRQPPALVEPDSGSTPTLDRGTHHAYST